MATDPASVDPLATPAPAPTPAPVPAAPTVAPAAPTAPVISGDPTTTPIPGPSPTPAPPVPEPAPVPAAPAAPAAPPAPAPTETVVVDGVAYEVAPEVATQIRQRQAATPSPAPAPAVPTPTPTDPNAALLNSIPDIDTRIYTDPRGLISDVLSATQANIDRQVERRVRDSMASARTVDEFWSSFYRDNDDLAPADMVVRHIADRDAGLYQTLGPAGFVQHLADSARREVLRIRGGTPQPGPEPRPTTTPNPTEPVVSPTPPGAPAAEPEPVVVQLKKRQAVKRSRGNV